MATGKRRPTIRAVWLGQELLKLRNEAGHSVRQMASILRTHPPTISKMENGIFPAGREDVENYLRVCGVQDEKRRHDLFTICRDAAQTGWWDGYRNDVAGVLMDSIWLESKATAIRMYTPMVIPGLLQTPAYAQAVMRKVDSDSTEEEITRWLEVRMTRQLIVTRHDPIRLQVILDETVLRRAAAEHEVAIKQLDYLAEAATRSHIEIRVLPFGSGVHASPGGGFEIHTLEDPYPEVGLVPTPGGDLCVEGDQVDQLERAYDRLLDVTLDTAASREFIIAERDKL